MASKKGGKASKQQPEVTLEMLIAVAEDFNSFMFTSPEEGIDLDLEYEDLLAEVTETSEELEATDTILQVTADTLDLLDIEYNASVAEEEAENDVEEEEEVKPATKSKGKGKPAPKVEEPEENGDDEAAKAADLALIKKTKDVEKMKGVAKAWGIRIPPPFYKDINKLREYLVGKLDGSIPIAEKASGKKEKAEKPAKKEKAPKAPKATEDKYTRSNALIDSLKKFSGNTREEIVNQADVLFVKNGGNTNTNVSNYMFGYVMPSLIILGIVSKTDDKYIWNK